jgi:hemolysin III
LYFASTLYHLAATGARTRIYTILDHCAIFILIAGTYTPFGLVAMSSEEGTTLMWLIWGIATAGIIYKLFFTGKYKLISTIIYLAMGWVAVLFVNPILESVPKNGLWWLLAGGLSYSFGTIFYLRKKIYSHSIWHVSVLFGSVVHFISIYVYVLPM